MKRPHTPQALLINWLAATALVVLFFGIAHQLDRDTEAARTLDTLDAQALAAEHRLQRAARALCASEIGHGARALWTPEGHLVCRRAPANATTVAATTDGAQP